MEAVRPRHSERPRYTFSEMSDDEKTTLKAALSAVWALVYRATQVPYLDLKQIDELKAALNILSCGLKGDEHFNKRAGYIVDCVRSCGILSIPSRKPKGTEEIMADCQRLQRHLAGS